MIRAQRRIHRLRPWGMTLLEVMLALAILSSLAMLLASWVQTAIRVAGHDRETQSWTVAANRLVDEVGTYLRTGDSIEVFEETVASTSGIASRVELKPPHELAILSRGHQMGVSGPAWIVFRFDISTQRILMTAAPLGTGTTPETRPRLVLHNVSSFTATTLPLERATLEREEDSISVLEVSIQGTEERGEIKRRFRMP